MSRDRTVGSADLAVDLDGTLLATDTLIEGAIRALFNRPGDLLAAGRALPRGRAHVKSALAAHSRDGMNTYPVRAELAAWLTEQSAAGRRLHLVTAADASVAEAAAARFGLFASVIASQNGVNLKGAAKRDALQQRFPDGFSYAGDCAADLPIFEAAQTAVLAGHRPALTREVAARGRAVEAAFPRRPAGLRGLIKAMRIHQWTKNLLMFIPLLLSGVFDAKPLLSVSLGFLLMGFSASGTYIINDLADLDSDRRHPTKQQRLLASGALSIANGMVLALALTGIGVLGGFLLSPAFGAIQVLYIATTLSYSLWLKRMAMIDVAVLAVLYALRLGMGAALAEVDLSHWLVIFALTFFLSLSLAKRQTEIVKAAAVGEGPIPGRGYRTSDAVLTLSMGLASGMMALLVMNMFLIFQAFMQANYLHPQMLWFAPFITFLWLSRIWLIAARGELDDDPVVFAIKDRISLALGGILLACVLTAVI
jgi:4-hydroxybenzoate polyprenyltransferase/phosphoserine phosphatase